MLTEIGTHALTSGNKRMDGEPALAMTVARRCRWVNLKGDWYYASPH
jgi:hypothetical protein